jgi:hypothetical protein
MIMGINGSYVMLDITSVGREHQEANADRLSHTFEMRQLRAIEKRPAAAREMCDTSS